jgi:gliding motility-associated-like protein
VLNTSGSGAGYGYFSQFNSLYFGGEITVCRGDTAVLDAGADRQSILWNTGSTERYLRVTEPGIYWATVTFRTCTATDTVAVSVIDVPLELGPDTSFCVNERLALVAGPDIGRYIWNGSVEDRFLIVDEPGLYRVSLTRDGCTVYDSIRVAALPAPQPDLGPDTALCRWQDYQLDAALPGASYLWQDGSTGPQLRVQEAGLYHVEVTSADGCTGRDSMVNRPVFEELDLGRDTLLCFGESLRFDLSFPGTSYLWQDGSTGPRYEIREAGLYHVLVDNGCQTFRDSVAAGYVDCSAAVHLASAFTPNGDGVNETFGPAYNGQITEFELRIFNRWGQEVFASRSPDAAWDGSFQGGACPAGVYVWQMYYYSIHQRRLRKVFTQGTVTLLR